MVTAGGSAGRKTSRADPFQNRIRCNGAYARGLSSTEKTCLANHFPPILGFLDFIVADLALVIKQYGSFVQVFPRKIKAWPRLTGFLGFMDLLTFSSI